MTVDSPRAHRAFSCRYVADSWLIPFPRWDHMRRSCSSRATGSPVRQVTRSALFPICYTANCALPATTEFSDHLVTLPASWRIARPSAISRGRSSLALAALVLQMEPPALED